MTEKRNRMTELIEAGKKHGVEVTVTTKPKGTGEIVLLPGIRATSDERRADLLQDDDGSGVVQ